jgi:hypothetical protein
MCENDPVKEEVMIPLIDLKTAGDYNLSGQQFYI